MSDPRSAASKALLEALPGNLKWVLILSDDATSPPMVGACGSPNLDPEDAILLATAWAKSRGAAVEKAKAEKGTADAKAN